MGQTVVEKIARAHLTEGPNRPLRPGDMVSLRPRHILTHDNTAAVLKKFRGLGAAHIRDPRQPVFALDHDIQNHSAENLATYRTIEEFALEEDVDFHAAGTGIGHQLMIERGYAIPGALVVASDSHANMYGAVGALGTPVVRTDAAAIWATGEFWWQIPRTVQVVLEGQLPAGLSGKDVILTLCGLYANEEVLNAAIEFAGPGVASLDMSARMSMANMTTEWGALTGWFPVDNTTLAYLAGRRTLLERHAIRRITGPLLEQWSGQPPAPDPDASYAARITLDLARVTPVVTGPDAVNRAHPVNQVEPERIAIQKAYLVSCVNSRLEDLEAAATALCGRHVANGVEFYVAAASREVQEAAQRSGAWGTLQEAGARMLPPGCGPCIGLGTGLLQPGEVGISATNRNFKGRMGSRDARAYLASPAVVAASAVAGYIAIPRRNDELATAAGTGPDYRLETFSTPELDGEEVEILEGFPRHLEGRLLYLPAHNLNTDGIYGKDYTYRDLPWEEMARVVMANYDPTFASRAQAGDILVGGSNFGTGSSREQAVTALQARGIALLIAASFSQTYLRNAFNNGFPCLECPALVERLGAELGGTEDPTIIPGDNLAVDFARGLIRWRNETFRFPPLGTVPQALVAGGGIENRIRQRMAASA